MNKKIEEDFFIFHFHQVYVFLILGTLLHLEWKHERCVRPCIVSCRYRGAQLASESHGVCSMHACAWHVGQVGFLVIIVHSGNGNSGQLKINIEGKKLNQ
jgi:hypothetical protein